MGQLLGLSILILVLYGIFHHFIKKSSGCIHKMEEDIYRQGFIDGMEYARHRFGNKNR